MQVKRDLAKLFRPKSIAIIGGRNEAVYVAENCAKLGFGGPVWHVHPTRGGYATLADLPQAPDAAFVCVNRQATLSVVEALRDMGAGGAVAYAAGFAEAAAELADGDDLQAALLRAAGDMPLIGPNWAHSKLGCDKSPILLKSKENGHGPYRVGFA